MMTPMEMVMFVMQVLGNDVQEVMVFWQYAASHKDIVQDGYLSLCLSVYLSTEMCSSMLHQRTPTVFLM